MGALGAGERDGARAQFGGELALDLPGAVAEPPGEPGYAFAVDHTVADQPHGPAHDVRADVPLGGAGHGVRAAAAAGPEAAAWAAAAVG
ncbi:hypothetical protein GA0115255_124692 [Streptomyces sp. Ncost-T6T-2b]|nr:hypothetical protein GA0115255_124692 [Streptomyces sp. Ncost-T6T-2b]